MGSRTFFGRRNQMTDLGRLKGARVGQPRGQIYALVQAGGHIDNFTDVIHLTVRCA
jgi:hypothetical protein